MTLRRTVAFTVFTLALAGCFGPKATQKQNSPALTTGGTTQDADGDVLETKSFQAVMRNGKVLIDPDHGAESGLWYGAVLGVGGAKANGVAFTHRFEDGYSVHTSNVNILKADPDFYVVWVAKDSTGAGAKRLGVLSSVLGDARHSIRYETMDDLASFPYVMITKESEKIPAQPGTSVAEVMLKKVDQ